LNTTGGSNTATGWGALGANTTGTNNTAVGRQALTANGTGIANTAVGAISLGCNTTGGSNTAVGQNSLGVNTSGCSNTAVGRNALAANTTGDLNTSAGLNALTANTTGSNNVGVGVNALRANTSGVTNTALGTSAQFNLTSGSGNITIGSLTNAVGYAPAYDITTEDNYISMGSTAVTNAYIQVAWTAVSDARDKTNLAPVPHGLDFVTALKPTAYQFRVDRDTQEATGPVHYGFLAQDILALEGDSNVIIDSSDSNKLRYTSDHLLPVLVNAIQEIASDLKALKIENANLKARLNAAGI
jgi:hypothetical protein